MNSSPANVRSEGILKSGKDNIHREMSYALELGGVGWGCGDYHRRGLGKERTGREGKETGSTCMSVWKSFI